ncbi:hypothetical protein [Indioceanicola profundi]|uniref:hypothetical protein n=1 Tax=Indioceanicola profundi TaxID=2220096 RepID=UPI000E6AD021|nr:hypothetical protein [Indioceanicola profundi]
MRRATLFRSKLLAISALALLHATPAPAQQPAEAPLSEETLQRFADLCQEVHEARSGKQQSMTALAEVDMDELAKKHGFTGQEETSAISMRIAMVNMYTPDDPDAQAMLNAVEDPDMKAMIARAKADAPAVKSKAEALAVCTAR